MATQTQTRIRLRGPVDRDVAQTVDMTPTWAAIMPALILALTNGTAEGQRMARGELERLAHEVDAANEAHRDGEERIGALESALARCISDLEGWAKSGPEGFMPEEESRIEEYYATLSNTPQ